MKVTFVLPCISMTGGVRVVVAYADRLRKRGHQVHVIHKPYPTIPLRSRVSALLKGQGNIPSEECRISDFGVTDLPSTTVRHAGPIVDADVPDADVVVATWWETAEWVASLSPEKGAKVHFVQHHEVFDYLPTARVRAAYKLPMYRIVVAQWLVDVLAKEYGCREVSLVPNGIEIRRFDAPPRQKNAIPTVGFFYALPHWKGCDVSIAAFQLAAERVPNLRLISFGALPPSRDLSLPAGTKYYRRPVPELLPKLYAQCDAWLFASRSEGFGLPLLEAMACRTPVIATTAGAAPELLQQGGGILVEKEDSQGMASAIEKISQLSEGQWQAMSDAAYAVATRYTLDDATILFERALESAIVRQRESICGI